MSFDIAKKFIDYILTGPLKRSEYVIIEFIGGEPFIETELVDKITDYFKLRSFELDHEWYWKYRLNFSTNGVNYGDCEVQAYIEKNIHKMSCGITIDGTKEKHDLQRVYPDGRGSYDDVRKNIDLYLKQFSPNTKVTFSREDLPMLKDSILHLWEIGITEVSANVVFEDVWKADDDILFERQLIELADYVLNNQLYDQYYCTLFDEKIGGYYTQGRGELAN